jgi:hypothetical protein
MPEVVDIGPREREDVRLCFFRRHCDQPALSSVGVRRDVSNGAWYLDVGVTGPLDLEREFAGLEVRVRATAPAVNAVTTLDRIA